MSEPNATSTGRGLRRRLKLLPLVVALTAALVLLCCAGGTGAFLLTSLGGEPEQDVAARAGTGCGQGGPVKLTGKVPSIGPYGQPQMHNAAAIIRTGSEMKVPPRGWVIAVATAMQESSLTNLGHLGSRNDHDSIGLFQQRPSQGWGTPEQLRDPAYASRKFYEKMLKVPGWQTRPLTDVAQRVQVSAFPDAYAKHEPIATQIVNALADGAARAAGAARALRCATTGEIAASGWAVPVPGVVVSGFRTAARRGHNGVDLAAPKETAIRVSATGRVLVSRCDPDFAGRLSCDVDGYPGKGGCGWFVDVLHAGNVITRYCHLIRKPDVRPGELVQANQVIGRVGSSGNSSGPHLHFEVHLNGDRSRNGAVDPARFMSERGAPLGGTS